MFQISGVPKEQITFYDPKDGVEKTMVRISPIERKIVVDVFDGVRAVPMSDTNDPVVVMTDFQEKNQPFPSKDMIEIRKIELIPLRTLSDREFAALATGQINVSVGNSRLDRRSVLDIMHNRNTARLSSLNGIAAVPESQNQFGDSGVTDVAGTPSFILDGGEELIVGIETELGTGFVAEELDPLDRDRERIAIPVMLKVGGFKVGPPKSADANAGRFAQITQRPNQSIPAAIQGRQ